MPAKQPRFNQLKLDMSPPSMQPWEMSPPSMSPLHMTPPNMKLPNFEVPAFKLPTLSLSKYFPPPSLYDEYLSHPPSTAEFSPFNANLLAIGTFSQNTKTTPKRPEAAGSEGTAKIYLFNVSDMEDEVFGDRDFPPDDARKKVIPGLNLLNTIETESAVIQIAWSPHDPELMIATLANGSVLLVALSMGRKPRIAILSTHLISSVPEDAIALGISFYPNDDTDETIVALSYGDGSVVVAALPDADEETEDNTLHELYILKPPEKAKEEPVVSVQFSADGKKLFASTPSGRVTCYKVPKRGGNAKRPGRLEWTDINMHSDAEGIRTSLVWPAAGLANVGRTRPLLLTGGPDGSMRVLDVSDNVMEPEVKQEVSMYYITDARKHGAIWNISPLPPLPTRKGMEKVGPGSFAAKAHPNIEIDEGEVGVAVSGLEGGVRIMIQRDQFSDVHLPQLDEEGKIVQDDEKLKRTGDGVELDWYGREKVMEWYNVVEFGGEASEQTQHEGKVFATTATALVDYDSIYKEEKKQYLRRGWRVVSMSFDDRKLCIWQIYVD